MNDFCIMIRWQMHHVVKIHFSQPLFSALYFDPVSSRVLSPSWVTSWHSELGLQTFVLHVPLSLPTGAWRHFQMPESRNYRAHGDRGQHQHGTCHRHQVRHPAAQRGFPVHGGQGIQQADSQRQRGGEANIKPDFVTACLACIMSRLPGV